MPTYIALYSFTQEGIKNIRNSPARLDKAKKAIESAGGKLKAFYMTMGRYDLVVIAEWPDDKTGAKFLLAQAAEGNVRSETLKAFTEDEYRQIISELP